MTFFLNFFLTKVNSTRVLRIVSLIETSKSHFENLPWIAYYIILILWQNLQLVDKLAKIFFWPNKWIEEVPLRCCCYDVLSQTFRRALNPRIRSLHVVTETSNQWLPYFRFSVCCYFWCSSPFLQPKIRILHQLQHPWLYFKSILMRHL